MKKVPVTTTTTTTDDDGFAKIKPLITARFETLKANKIFNTKYDRDEIVAAYLDAFPTPELKQDHNCSACKSFIRQVGGMVVLGANGEKHTLWDLEESQVPGILRESVKALAKYVKSKPVDGLFFHDMPSAGVDKNLDKVTNIIWEHFYLKIPKQYVNNKDNTLGKASAELRETKNVLMRGLDELTDDAVATVLELIAQGSLYRGNEHEACVKKFKAIKELYALVPAKPAAKREAFCWLTAGTESAAICRIRNSAIGTLLIDLSEGTEVDDAVRKFEKVVAPANYKRPTALITPRMVEAAKARLTELGLISALNRRRLDSRDLTAANALFVYRPTVTNTDVFDLVKGEAKASTKTLGKVEQVHIDDFVAKVMPTAKSIKLLMENEHLGNMMTLTGPQDAESNNLMKWGNSFCWSYTGGVADSTLRARVAELGGRVDGVLRFSHTWNYDGNNQSLMDLHVFMPWYTHTPTAAKEVHDHYPSTRRVGWNHRTDQQSGGNQDVDFTATPGKAVPVENITFPSMAKLPEGTYTFKIHNWQMRPGTTSGFKAEIEFGGQVFHYFRKEAVGNKEWITLAEATLKDGKFTIKHITPPSVSTETKWGVTTGTWRTVKAITLSPNHWDKPVGNKHWFFLLDGCVSDEATRPFYNEFLIEELAKDRKTMEVLGSKIEVAPAEGAELSGLGFSETIRNRIYAEVEGKFKRTIEIVF